MAGLNQNSRVTLVEVAREAGVSTGVASAALSEGIPAIRMTEDTRRRVRDVADRLGFMPNRAARTLVSKRSTLVGIIAPPLTAPVEAAQIHSLDTTVRNAGYMPVICNVHHPATEEDHEPLLAQIQELIAHQVEGLILYQTVPLPSVILNEIERVSLPVVYVDWVPENAKKGIVFDRSQSCRQFMQHLYNFGHRDVALIVTPHHLHVRPQAVVLPYRQAAAEFGIRLRELEKWLLPSCAERMEATYRLVSECIKQEAPPTAIIFDNEQDAFAGLTAIQEAGFQVPDDISILGRDDQPLSRIMRPRLTTARLLDRELVAETAFSMLDKWVNNGNSQREVVTMYQEAVFRESTGPVRKS